MEPKIVRMELNEHELRAKVIVPDMNPVGAICSLQHSHADLSDMTPEHFEYEVKVSQDCERLSPGHLRRCAKNMAQLRRFIVAEERMR